MIPAAETGLPHASQFGSVTIDQLNLNDMIGPAVVVDVRSLIGTVSKGETTHLAHSPVIDRAFLEAWEKENGCPSSG